MLALGQEANPRLREVLRSLAEGYDLGPALQRGGGWPWAAVRSLPTGFAELDEATGVGGIPLGRISQVYGPPSSGKLSLVSQVIARAQERELPAAYIDLARNFHALPLSSTSATPLLLLEPQDAVQAWQMAERTIASGQVPLTVMDVSDPAALPPAELLSQALRRLVGEIARQHVALLLLSQADGPQEGARALRHHASLRIQVQRLDWIRRGGDIVGQRSLVTITKNRCAPPHRSMELRLWGALDGP